MSSSQAVEKQATDTSTILASCADFLLVRHSIFSDYVTSQRKVCARGYNSRTHDYTQPRDRNQHPSDMITGFKKINNLKLVYN